MDCMGGRIHFDYFVGLLDGDLTKKSRVKKLKDCHMPFLDSNQSTNFND